MDSRSMWPTRNDLPDKVRAGAMFDSVVNEIIEHADDLAERAVELGGTAFGTARIAAKASRLPEYPLSISSGHDHVAALSAVIAKFGASARAGIDAANALGDADTADLFHEISRGVDKLLWKVEAHGAAKD